MCVIIHKPEDNDIPEEIFKKCWAKNPDGTGFMYIDSGNVQIVKGLMQYEEFIKQYQKYDCIHKEVVFHFRLASAGKVTPDQTHPFWVFQDGELKKDLAFVHNGHIVKYDEFNTEKSDTILFKENILMKLPRDFLFNEAIMELINDYIDYSTIIFMHQNGTIKMIGNIVDSIFLKGSWFSNDLWQEKEEN
jgi:hypothetical protein